MAKKSIFDPSNSEPGGTSGLDRFNAPPAHSYSQMPPEMVDGETAESDEVDPELVKQIPPEQTVGPEPVNEIKDALDERAAEDKSPEIESD